MPTATRQSAKRPFPPLHPNKYPNTRLRLAQALRRPACRSRRLFMRFQPTKTLVLTPSAGSASTSFSGTPETARVYNAGPGDVFLRFTLTKGAGDTATSTDMILPARYLEYYEIQTVDTVSAYCATSATVNVTLGGGK
jgi:hypothetical protein